MEGAVLWAGSLLPPAPGGLLDVADHPVPTGREEVWWFTLLKRLRGLHDEAALTGEDYQFKIETPEACAPSPSTRPNRSAV